MKKEHISTALKIAKEIIYLLAIVFFLKGTIVEAYIIPSSSMEPTLQIGDMILVNKLSYGLRLPFVPKTLYRYDAPERGDVVVFTRPNDPSTSIIKRVIGLPGDTVEVRGTSVYVNGNILDETYPRWLEGGIHDFGPEKVPADSIFLMGDNRDHSKDSRLWEDSHYLNLNLVQGRALMIYWNTKFKVDRVFDAIR